MRFLRHWVCGWFESAVISYLLINRHENLLDFHLVLLMVLHAARVLVRALPTIIHFIHYLYRPLAQLWSQLRLEPVWVLLPFTTLHRIGNPPNIGIFLIQKLLGAFVIFFLIGPNRARFNQVTSTRRNLWAIL